VWTLGTCWYGFVDCWRWRFRRGFASFRAFRRLKKGNVDIKFSCSRCGQHIAVDETAAGLTAACPNCKQALVVPFQGLSGAMPPPVQPPSRPPEQRKPYSTRLPLHTKLIVLAVGGIAGVAVLLGASVLMRFSAADKRSRNAQELAHAASPANKNLASPSNGLPKPTEASPTRQTESATKVEAAVKSANAPELAREVPPTNKNLSSPSKAMPKPAEASPVSQTRSSSEVEATVKSLLAEYIKNADALSAQGKKLEALCAYNNARTFDPRTKASRRRLTR
jgi:hypothetical protein